MKISKRLLVVSSVFAPVFAIGALAASNWSFDLMHTLPECSHTGKPSTWCTKQDQKAAAKASGMEDKVAEILDRATDPETARITIAYFSFSNTAVFDALCTKGKDGFQIEGFFDNDYNTSDSLPTKLEKNCQGAEKGNVDVHFLGEKDTTDESNIVWRLHHNKFLVVDPGDGSPVSVNFSSGNLSSFGLSLHFDHWAMLEAPRNSNLVKQHFCVIDALRKAVDPDGDGKDKIDDPAKYRSALNSCLKKVKSLYSDDPSWVEDAIAEEEIAPLFSPNPKDQIAVVLIDNINRVRKGGKIYGAMQHFLHAKIANALKAAVKRGVEVSLLMDDDIHTGESEVPGVQEFYRKQLAPAVSGIDIRFMVTNASDRQMMHNKFLVLEGVDTLKTTRVFSGAGHFTNSGMRNNYENFYLSQNSRLSAAYKRLYRYMEERSVSEEEAAE